MTSGKLVLLISVMSVLLEVLLSLLSLLPFPWSGKSDYDSKSVVGKSRLDRESESFLTMVVAVLLGLAVIAFLVFAGLSLLSAGAR